MTTTDRPARALPSMGHRRMLIVPDFFDRASELRASFDAAVDPDVTTARHFSWSYWNLPGQYTYLRTPARSFFPEELFAAFEERLCSWGKSALGCNLVNSWWLSFYVEGCRQELHADVAHGPWAWVYSVTNWEGRRFQGGETQVARSEMLDYWRRGVTYFRGEHPGADRHRLLEEVPAHFGQLVVFDGRIPHGVREVRGTQDPRDSRVVLHGWFEPPALQVEGSLVRADVVAAIGDAHARLRSRLEDFDDADGTLISRLEVAASGIVERVVVLTNTLETSGDDPAASEALARAIVEVLGDVRFSAADGDTRIIVPISAKR